MAEQEDGPEQAGGALEHRQSDELRELVRYLKALADESRLRLVGILANGGRSVEELASLLDLRAATVSHHLNLLKALDLVAMRPEGNTHIYQLNRKGLGRMSLLLSAPEHLPVIDGAQGHAWERKVLRDFFAGDRLKGIPAYRKKRLVILTWLTNQFEGGRTYTEAEVNALIKRYHPDTAALRRYLVDERFMQRDHGIYWRREVPAAPDAPSPANQARAAGRARHDHAERGLPPDRKVSRQPSAWCTAGLCAPA